MVTFLNCEKDELRSELSGIWIELTNRNDTIDFDSWGSEDVFILRRGFELRNGYSLPKYGSGLYRYILKPDTILLNNMLSSSAGYTSHFFQMNSSRDSFEIGNFYDTIISVHQPIIFYKVR